jgi:hypothetical protein
VVGDGLGVRFPLDHNQGMTDSVGSALVVDAANVIGSVPDGWWRDRRAAAARLRDQLTAADLPFDEVILVVEGKARGIANAPRVQVVNAPGTGDDAIVETVARLGGPTTVATADRGLRERVTALGAAVIGPGTLRKSLTEPEGTPDTWR